MIRVLVLAAMVAVTGCGVPMPAGTDPSVRPVPSAPVTPRAPELDQPLIAAATHGDGAVVRRLVAAGASPQARDGSAATALVRAAYGNHLDAAAALIAAGADVNAQDDTRQSAYLIATSEVGDDPRLLELTLGAGADIDAKDRFNGTGLIRAAERGHAAIVAMLLRAGIDRDHVNRLGYTALHEAIIFGGGDERHTATVRALVDGGVDVDIPTDGVRPLRLAEDRGQHRVAAVLRAAGALR